jgi:hypothetical protein
MDAEGGARSRFDLDEVGAKTGNRFPHRKSGSLPDLYEDDYGGYTDDDPNAGQRRPHSVPP